MPSASSPAFARSLLPFLLCGLAPVLGCNGTSSTYNGLNMNDFFPFDGVREAEFVNADAAVPYHMFSHKVDPTVVDADGRETATLEMSTDDGTLLYSVKWSVRSNQAVHIEAWADGASSDFTVFDPPISVVDAYSVTGDTLETTTGGMTFTGTYVGPEDCSVLWGGLDWADCTHITIDDGDGDPMAGPKFAGDYWLVARFGQALMQLTGDSQPWALAQWDSGGA